MWPDPASCVLTGTTVKGLLADPELRAVARGLMADALAVAESHGIGLDIDLDANTDPDQASGAQILNAPGL